MVRRKEHVRSCRGGAPREVLRGLGRLCFVIYGDCVQFLDRGSKKLNFSSRLLLARSCMVDAYLRQQKFRTKAYLRAATGVVEYFMLRVSVGTLCCISHGLTLKLQALDPKGQCPLVPVSGIERPQALNLQKEKCRRGPCLLLALGQPLWEQHGSQSWSSDSQDVWFLIQCSSEGNWQHRGVTTPRQGF